MQRSLVIAFAAVLFLSACASAPESEQTAALSSAPAAAAKTEPGENAGSMPARKGAQTESEVPAATIIEGTGVFIDEKRASRGVAKASSATGRFTLNFEEEDISQVIKTVLGDTLQRNYVLAKGVKGKVTLQTSKPIAEKDLLPTLEMFLRLNGAVMREEKGTFHIMPHATALQSAPVPRLAKPGAKLPVGMQVRLVPLEYVGAQEMKKILEPLLPKGALVRVDPVRNMMMFAGSSASIERILETIAIFDVNWLKGMSVALFKLKNVEAATIVTELDKLFGELAQGPLAGMFKLIPIDRLNAVLAISPQAEYLKQAREWVAQLDQGGAGGRTLHIYRVQNGKAEDLAGVLNELFTGTTRKTKAPKTAPGTTPASVGGKTDASGRPVGAKAAKGKKKAQPRPVTATATATVNVGAEELSDVRIIADDRNNALLVMATVPEFETIQSALRKLDIPPRQVLVEATIAEVTLSGELQYGLQWFFKNNNVSGDLLGTGNLDLPQDQNLTKVLGSGFNYALSDSAGIVRALLHTLASDNKVKVLSSPQLLVIDNETASISVGDQVPVSSGTTFSGQGELLTSNIQYRDTGVKLEVTPHINAGGLVTLEVLQEVEDVGSIEETTNQRGFLRRSISSKVAVQSGKTIVLGGLIKENRTRGRSGVPVLYEIPIVGNLFGGTSEERIRTELIVLLTPKVTNNQAQADAVTRELKARMGAVSELLNGWGTDSGAPE